MTTHPTRPGAIALVGSGEYLPQMREIDLLRALKRDDEARALLTGADALERAGADDSADDSTDASTDGRAIALLASS